MTGVKLYSLGYVRATSRLLGVLYHEKIFVGGGGAGSSIAPKLMDWIWSFRMPLFLLVIVSGYFGHMELAKYGLRGNLVRCSWHIVLSFLVAHFAFAAIHRLTSFGGLFAPGGPYRPLGLPSWGRGLLAILLATGPTLVLLVDLDRRTRWLIPSSYAGPICPNLRTQEILR